MHTRILLSYYEGIETIANANGRKKNYEKDPSFRGKLSRERSWRRVMRVHQFSQQGEVGLSAPEREGGATVTFEQLDYGRCASCLRSNQYIVG